MAVNSKSGGSSGAAGARLLDGENPNTFDLDDARHWAQVYTELVGLTEDLVRLTREAADGREEAGNPASDLRLINKQLKRLRSRLEFWNQHVLDLTKRRAEPA